MGKGKLFSGGAAANEFQISFFFHFFSANCVSFIQSFYISNKTSSMCITCFMNVCKDDFYPH